jgi:hypothetical protein
MDRPRYHLRHEDLAWRIVEDEGVLVDLVRQRLHLCNETASFVVETLQAEPTLDDLVRRLCEVYDVDATTAHADVSRLLQTLEQEGVVATKGG